MPMNTERLPLNATYQIVVLGAERDLGDILETHDRVAHC